MFNNKEERDNNIFNNNEINKENDNNGDYFSTNKNIINKKSVNNINKKLEKKPK